MHSIFSVLVASMAVIMISACDTNLVEDVPPVLTEICEASPGGEPIFDAAPGPILFTSYESGTSQLYSMRADGSDVRQLSSDPEFPITDAVWSPGGCQILIATPKQNTHDPGEYFFITDSTGRGGKPVFSDAMIANGWLGLNPVWSPDGTQLVFQKPHPDPIGVSDLAVIDLRTSETRVISNVFEEWEKVVTDWSLDGRLLLGHTQSFFNDSQGRRSSYDYATIWNTNGDSLASFGLRSWQTSWPIWSPTEDRVAVLVTVNGERGLYDYSPATEQYLLISKGFYNNFLPVAWSSDGKFVLARANEEPFSPGSIVMVNTIDGHVEDISPFPGTDSRPTSWKVPLN